jgi:hypothetical protein
MKKFKKRTIKPANINKNTRMLSYRLKHINLLMQFDIYIYIIISSGLMHVVYLTLYNKKILKILNRKKKKKKKEK